MDSFDSNDFLMMEVWISHVSSAGETGIIPLKVNLFFFYDYYLGLSNLNAPTAGGPVWRLSWFSPALGEAQGGE